MSATMPDHDTPPAGALELDVQELFAELGELGYANRKLSELAAAQRERIAELEAEVRAWHAVNPGGLPDAAEPAP